MFHAEHFWYLASVSRSRSDFVPRGTLRLREIRIRKAQGLFHVEQFSVNGDNLHRMARSEGSMVIFAAAEEKNSICAGLQGFDWEPVEVSGLAGFGLDGRGVFQGGEDC